MIHIQCWEPLKETTDGQAGAANRALHGSSPWGRGDLDVYGSGVGDSYDHLMVPGTSLSHEDP